MLPLVLALLVSVNADAKKYPFDIDTSREVVITRSATAGTKMVKVVAYGRTVDKAIDQAMMDAVVALTFFGASGENEMEACPAILLDGRAAYDEKKEFFGQFFQKGHFLSRRQDINFFLIQTYNSPHFIHSTVFFTFEAGEVCHRSVRHRLKHVAPSGQEPRFMRTRTVFRADKQETLSPAFTRRGK